MEVSDLDYMFVLQGEDGKFSIYVHSRPGFVLSEATTQSKYFLNRQVTDSIQVRCYQNVSDHFGFFLC